MENISTIDNLTNDIKIKHSLKYSNDFTFVPIKNKDNKDIIIQTSKLLIPYGVEKNDQKTIDISFINMNNDINIKGLYDYLTNLYKIIKNRYKEYIVKEIIKNGNIVRLKLLKCKIYNQYRREIVNIPTNTYGQFIIHLSGVWIVKNEIWFSINVLQIKIDEPIYLNSYSFIDKNIPKPLKIPPPPPLPPPPKLAQNKIIITKVGKKDEQNSNTPIISVNEIQKILDNLTKIKI